jgi:hypothetical protein
MASARCGVPRFVAVAVTILSLISTICAQAAEKPNILFIMGRRHRLDAGRLINVA